MSTMQPIQPIAKDLLHEKVSDAIISYIYRNGLKIGDKLPGERQLAQELMVGRNSVRLGLCQLEEAGMSFTGLGAEHDLVEIVELAEHPWFLAVQCHPEFRSKPTQSHPLFRGFLRASLERREVRKKAEAARTRAALHG